MATTTITNSPAILTNFNYPTRHNNTPFLPHTFIPLNFTPKLNPRLRVSNNALFSSKKWNRIPVISCSSGGSGSGSGNSGISAEMFDDSVKESSINLKLPRRSLLVQFTCNACGEETKRLINRVAYERGTVFVQCSGCLQHHKLADNLGLIVEYDFRNEIDQD